MRFKTFNETSDRIRFKLIFYYWVLDEIGRKVGYWQLIINNVMSDVLKTHFQRQILKDFNLIHDFFCRGLSHMSSMSRWNISSY